MMARTEEDRVMGEEQSARDIRINDITREGEGVDAYFNVWN